MKLFTKVYIFSTCLCSLLYGALENVDPYKNNPAIAWAKKPAHFLLEKLENDKTLILEDGSFWKIHSDFSSSDWNLQDPLAIIVQTNWFSSYASPYILLNLRSSATVDVDLFPNANPKDLPLTISSLDILQNTLTLSDTSKWSVLQDFIATFYYFRVSDGIILANAASSDNIAQDSNLILINAKTRQYIKVQPFFPKAPSPK